MIEFILPKFGTTRSIHIRELGDPKLKLGATVENGPSKLWHIIDIFPSLSAFDSTISSCWHLLSATGVVCK